MSIRVPDLAHLSVLRFAGADALAFLQGQVSNDTRRLADGFPLLAAYSSAQGRVVAVLHLLPHSSGVLAILPREIALPTLERMKKFVLRSKVKIEDLSEQYAVAGAYDASALDPGQLPPASTAAAGAAYLERDGLAVARVTDGAQSAAPRYWVVRRREYPQVFAATSEQFVAQMLNLDRLDAISFTKGCYTGQEIIARTQHLGRIKRRLSRLRLPPGSWSIGQPLRLADGRTGRLTDVVPVGGGYEALAVLSLDATGAADADTGGGTGTGTGTGETVSAEELPLPYRHGAATV